MLAIDNKIISSEVLDTHFACNLQACRGACCVQGDTGAPLEPAELTEIANAYPHIEDLLTQEAKTAIAQQGLYVTTQPVCKPLYYLYKPNGRLCLRHFYRTRRGYMCFSASL